jgi:hypothetical protein
VRLVAVTRSPSGVSLLLLYGLLIAMVVLRRRGARQTLPGSLAKGERQRPLLMTWLDPVLGLVFIGSVLWSLVSRDLGHVVVALLGAAGGIPIGVARARTMYVRAVPEASCVVFRRSQLEYGLLGLLLVLRLAEDAIARQHSGIVTFSLCALIALAVSESVARAAAVTALYRRDARVLRAAS